MSARSGTPVAVVTGGGGGIGAAIAMELGRRGTYVVTVDPLVSVDGSAPIASDESAEPTTAERIVAAGGRARASAASVTDAEAIHALFDELVAEHGRVDGVVNVAGITRPTGFASGSEEDWAAVLSVHLDGYVNMLSAALPIMAEAGSGRIVGVTSGSGWRAADAGAYSCAKRAVASLTWQLGRAAPAGVSVNAISPIAMTRMVTAAIARAKAAAKPTAPPKPSGDAAPKAGRATGGLSLGGMPSPEALGPLGAHLASLDGTSLRGQILFAGGSEVALVRPPRLLEVVRTPDSRGVVRVLDGLVESWCAAEATQHTTGGANPRFAALFGDEEGWAEPIGLAAPDRRVLVVGHGPMATLTCRHLNDRAVVTVPAMAVPGDAGAVRDLLDQAAASVHGPLDAVVVEVTESAAEPDDGSWQSILTDHGGLASRIADDTRWSRAAAQHSAAAAHPLRIVFLVDAATPAGRSRAQALAQLARAGAGATESRVHAFVIAIEDREQRAATSALAAQLAVDERAIGLAGAELVVGDGWMGLRSHPTPAGSIVFGGPDLPAWFDAAIADMAGTGLP